MGDQDPKGPADPQNGGNPTGNQPGNPDPNVVALQQKLTEKDVELKRLESKLSDLENKTGAGDETSKIIGEMNKTISELTNSISSMQSEKEKEVLAREYPDIVPELLLGKTPEERKTLVEAQRAKTKAQFESAPSAHTPRFTDRASVEKELDNVKTSKTMSTDEKLQKIRELKESLDEF